MKPIGSDFCYMAGGGVVWVSESEARAMFQRPVKPQWTPQDIIDVMHGRYLAAEMLRQYEKLKLDCQDWLYTGEPAIFVLGLSPLIEGPGEPFVGPIDADPNPYWRNHCRELH